MNTPSPGHRPPERPHKLLLATTNQGKLREYRRLFADLPLELLSPADAGIALEVAEDADTFAGNARLKAAAFARESGLPTLADDSGLEVDALGGEPGTRSARYAGDDATDAERLSFLLGKMKDVPWEKRSARFRCAIALVLPDGNVRYTDGTAEGIIALTPRGENGFGYDPVFYLPSRERTMAEITAEEKDRISHRGEAARRAHDMLAEEFGG